MTTLKPIEPCWKRYVFVFHKMRRFSVFRAMTYEVLFSMNFSGKIFDFGGGETVGYYKMLLDKINIGTYESANINSELKPTYLIKTDAEIPVNKDYYDVIISMNTLEHVYDIDFYLSEFTRILKDGGKIVISVPFIFRIHGCPDDFNRYTDSWWNRKLISLGYKDVKVLPLVWDPLITAISIIENPIKWYWKVIRYIAPLIVLLKNFKNKLIFIITKRSYKYDYRSNYPVGYIITGINSK